VDESSQGSKANLADIKENEMFRTKNHRRNLVVGLPFLCAALVSAQPAVSRGAAAPLFLTATNATPNNFLAVVNANSKEVDYVPTGGTGGIPAGSNAGAIAVSGRLAAVINFGSNNVTIFQRMGGTMEPMAMVQTAAPPVSVAFGHGHLVVLETTMAESFPVFGTNVMGAADGAVPLVLADGSAGQIVTFAGGVMYQEKTGSVAMMSLSTNGSAGLSGPNVSITLPPAPNNNTPLGMVARGANVYVSIAHSDLIVLVQNGKIVSMAAGPAAANAAGTIVHAPCWDALYGHFLFSTDSPGKQIVRYLVSDTNIFYDKATVATFAGGATDLAIDGSVLGVIDAGDGTTSNASLFDIDSEGELTLRFAVKIPGGINGAAIIP
jgi:hypothetical protein